MLTRRMQIQLIADRLAGAGNGNRVRVREFEEPWRRCWLAVSEAGPGTAQAALLAALQGTPDYESVLGAILAAAPGRLSAQFPSLAQIAEELPPVTWLWPDWMPKGMISLLGAAPGAGKSYVALDLAKRIIGGETWPDGTPLPGDCAGTVVYIDAEAIPQVINERAERWGMDRRRLFLMLPEPNDVIDFGKLEYRDHLVELMHGVGPALVIVDSLSSISVRGENNVEDVRQVLAFLNAVAREFDCGLLLIHHLRKHTLPLITELGIDDFRGSGHIIAMSRSVMGLSLVQTGPEVDRNGPRKLELVKTNLARYPDPLGCEFVQMHPAGVFLKWQSEAPRSYQEPTKEDECGVWLVRYLAESGEPMRPADVIEAAEEAGYNRRMVYRAREALNGRIENTAGRKHPDNCWLLVVQDEAV